MLLLSIEYKNTPSWRFLLTTFRKRLYQEIVTELYGERGNSCAESNDDGVSIEWLANTPMPGK
jgi:hypothetical protein